MDLSKIEHEAAFRVGSVLKASRLRLGMSQSEFAAFLGLKTRYSVINMEAGNSFPNPRTLATIEEKLGLKIGFIE